MEKEGVGEQQIEPFAAHVQELYQIDITEELKSLWSEGKDLAELGISILSAQIGKKIEVTSPEMFNDFLRYHYMKQIDTRWQNHLDQLEALRESVNLRTYAQKNPLLEYKLEGFDIFDSMITSIRDYMALLMVRVQIQSDTKVPTRSAKRQSVNLHRDMSSFSRNDAPSGQTGPVQVKRTAPKVGRNDPCPCGSGKKYKHCHGRNA